MRDALLLDLADATPGHPTGREREAGPREVVVEWDRGVDGVGGRG